jgi:hypothetical protein
MSNLHRVRDIGLVLGGVLVGACLFTAPRHASSAYREGDAIKGAIILEKAKPEITYQPNNPEGWGGMQRVPAGHVFGRERTASRFYPTNADCAAVKLDIWIDRGMMTYAVLNNPTTGNQAIEAADEPGRTTMLIGEKNCRVRVLIERPDFSSSRGQ